MWERGGWESFPNTYQTQIIKVTQTQKTSSSSYFLFPLTYSQWLIQPHQLIAILPYPVTQSKLVIPDTCSVLAIENNHVKRLQRSQPWRQERPQLAELPPFSILSLSAVKPGGAERVAGPGILLWLWPIILAATRAERDLFPSPSGETYLEIRDPWSDQECGACRFFELRYSSTLDTLEVVGPNLLYSFLSKESSLSLRSSVSISWEYSQAVHRPKSEHSHKRLLHPVQLYI